MRHADPSDIASDFECAHNEESLRKARLAAAPEQVVNADGTWPTTECVDCGEDIERERLLMGKVRCFVCQNTLELKRKQYAQRY